MTKVAACQGKAQFTSRQVARQAIRRMHPPRGFQYGIYRCTHCGYFHIGTERR